MNEIPPWWVWLSAAMFVANILMFGAIAFLAFTLAKFIKETQPKVNDLAKRVEQVAGRVEDVAKQVQETVATVGGRARGVVGSAETIAQSASRQFERFSPFVVGAVTAIRFVKGLNDLRQEQKARGRRRAGGGLLKALLRRR